MKNETQLEMYVRREFEKIMQEADPVMERNGYGYLEPVVDACWKFFLMGWNAACDYKL